MYTYSQYNGYKRADFVFEGKKALIVFPNTEKNGKWMMKMEYFDAFPNLELELLSRGWHLCYLENKSRWGIDEDSDRKARFADFIHEEFGLEKRFTCVGMSCGGICSVNFAARYPEYTACLYLDAPVMNLISTPLGLGIGTSLGESVWNEIKDAYGFDIPTLMTWREHPIDKIPILAEHKIPVAMIYGKDDMTVPYVENGIVLERYYNKLGLPLFCVGKENCGHHPHGLSDPRPLADFIDSNT